MAEPPEISSVVSNNRGRGRKRHTSQFPPSSSPPRSVDQELPEIPSSSGTPSVPPAPFPFSFEPPSPSASRETRMRTRQVEGTIPSPGGRSLRKRPRVDYTFEQQLEAENGPKLTPNASRSIKRRRTDVVLNENELDDDSEARSEARSKRRASEQPQSASTRRRTTGKGLVEPQTYAPTHHDDVEVQDTIEVGGHHSEESDESLIRRTSSGSSSHDTKTAPGSASSDSPATRPSLSRLSPPAPKVSLLSQSLPLPPYPLFSGESLPKGLQAGVQVNTNTVVPDEQGNDAKATTHHPLNMEDGPDSLGHLTPYIKGSGVLYPEYLEDDPEPEVDPSCDPEPYHERAPKVDAEVDLNADANANLEPVPNATREMAPNSVNGQSSEDAALQEYAISNYQLEGPEGTPADTAANSPSADAEGAAQPPDKKQFRFRQTRAASEFTDLFKDLKSLSPVELYRRLEVANEALVAWQAEFKELKKITDDFDNAARYQKEEDSFRRRSSLMLSRNPSYNPIERDFIVRGERAQDNIDPLVKYGRQQDRVMANAYGFEYDPRPDKIGNQNPIAQRTGAGRQGRLRERPKQTAKAAELDDPIVLPGKRTRKAPERFAGDEVISRSSTPVPTQRRGRRSALAPENGEHNPPQPQSQAKALSQPSTHTHNQSHTQPLSRPYSHPHTQPHIHPHSQPHTQTQAQAQSVPIQNPLPILPEETETEVPKKKGKGGRPRKNPIPEPVPEAAPTPAAELEPTAAPQPLPEPESEPDQSQAPSETRKSQTQPKITVLFKTQPKVEARLQRDTEMNAESSNPSAKRERETEEVAEEQPTRKRRRRAPVSASDYAPALVLAPPSAPAAPIIEDEDDDMENGIESQAPAKPLRRRTTKKTENYPEPSNTTASTSFTTSSNTSFTAPVEEPRPRTASSTATADTVTSTSNYQLREKRQRKFTNDINEDDFIEEPKRKRVRRTPKKTQAKKEDILPAPPAPPAPEPATLQQPEPEAPTVPKPPTRIRIKSKTNPIPNPTSTPASSAPSLTPSTNLAPANIHSLINGSTNGNGNVVGNGTSQFDAADAESRAEPSKDYSTMTKSEKMSASMKARWASGSMGGAVIKRRATLAAKKQSVNTPGATNAATPDQAPTPVSTNRPTPDGDIDDVDDDDDDVTATEE
ncbi:hypothetical protein F4781DRAFT_442609 [Annulohypoxylon bovei var. microspora]|nr:hypothetical protein F4781DRAFT_442609 [Annulohypoxylon bovei var. microspora]